MFVIWTPQVTKNALLRNEKPIALNCILVWMGGIAQDVELLTDWFH
jgi:hypothetical protein